MHTCWRIHRLSELLYTGHMSVAYRSSRGRGISTDRARTGVQVRRRKRVDISDLFNLGGEIGP